jgi:spoIIIJ-associated protein
MKDAIFTGTDVAAAVAAAARALGRGPETLRYVVLDPGRPGGLGLKPTSAQIAVMFEEGATPPAAAGARAPAEEEAAAAPPAAGWPGAIRQVIDALVQAGDLELTVEVLEEEDSLRVRLSGPDREFFLQDGGEPLSALDHLLRKLATPGDRRRLALECEGYRNIRDEALRDTALRLAEGVRQDGRSRRTEPLNAYERRIIHVTLAEVPGVRSYSVGEEGDRRVVVALAVPPDPEGDPGA